MCDIRLLAHRDRLFSELSSFSVDAPRQDLFMLGNGRVSAALGWGEQVNDLGWVLGPYYETGFNRHVADGGPVESTYFGTQTIRLDSSAPGIAWETQFLGRIRHTGILVSRLRSERIQWDTMDCCSITDNAILRLHFIKNMKGDHSPAHDLDIAWREPDENKRGWHPEFSRHMDPKTGLDQLRVRIHDARGHTRTMTSSFDVPVLFTEAGSQIRIPSLGADETFVFTQVLSFQASTFADAGTARSMLSYPLKTLEDVEAYWKSWSGSGVQVETSDARFDDLIDSVKVWCKVQKSEHGVFTPMIFYSDAYVRDCNGPVRLFLELGMADEMAGVLDFFRRGAVDNHLHASGLQHSGVNNIPLDQDVFPDESIEWGLLDPGKAEIPSYIILWHWWHFLSTGDPAPFVTNWEFLIRCLESQRISESGWICFHGDETYRYLGMKEFSGIDRPEYFGLFEGHEDDVGSFEATLLYLVALEAMRFVAGILGRQDTLHPLDERADAIIRGFDDNFWSQEDGCFRMACGGSTGFLRAPHAIPLSTLGWLTAFNGGLPIPIDGMKAKASWETTLSFLDSTGWRSASPELPVTDGHLPGLMICGASIYDTDDILSIADRVMALATPAGAYAEFYDDFHADAARGYHGRAWGRLRPWESGINVSGMLYALTGLSFDVPSHAIHIRPRLLGKMSHARLKGWKCREMQIDLEITRKGNQVVYTASNTGSTVVRLLDDASGGVRELLPGESHGGAWGMGGDRA